MTFLPNTEPVKEFKAQIRLKNDGHSVFCNIKEHKRTNSNGAGGKLFQKGVFAVSKKNT